MKQRKLLALALFTMAFMISCSKDDSPSTPATPAPTISRFTPNYGTVGTQFEIIGTNFSTTISKNTVKIGAVTATVSAATATKITTKVPQGAITAKVSVTVGGNTATSTDKFTVTQPQAANKAPTITTTSLSAAEDLQSGAEVGQVDATDDDGDALTFSMTDESGTFVMDATTGTISLDEGKTLDFETTPEYTVTIGVADEKGGADSKDITITITDVDESLAADPTSFVTTWQTTTDNESIEIGVHNGLTYNYTIEWGDGVTEDITETANPKHEYATAGTYTVAIKGLFPAIRMSEITDGASNNKLLSIEQWGTNPWVTMFNAFSDCSNVILNATDVPDLSQVTFMRNMFKNCFGLGDPDLNGWDTTTVEDMAGMFSNTAFNGNIEQWDVSNVNDMSNMFSGATLFNGDISGWETINVTDMAFMFSGATSFNADIGGWKTDNVFGMTSMFSGATSFNQDIGGWKTGNVLGMTSMFSGATSFNQDISGWDTGNVFNIAGMFSGATSFDQSLGAWNIGLLSNMLDMLDNCGMSPQNYSDTLIGWAANNPPQDVNFEAEGLQYLCIASDARDALLNLGWDINDGGLAELCP